MRRPTLIAIAFATYVGSGFSQTSYVVSGFSRTQTRTVQDGIYTAEQAKRGQASYAEHCASCHLEDLSGTDRGPALAGDPFMNNWVDLTVGDLFERAYRTMPQDRPGTLMPETTADILALVLQANGFPAGSTELPPDAAALGGIVIKRKR
jgi:mono/diheme cytochrome c family protein